MAKTNLLRHIIKFKKRSIETDDLGNRIDNTNYQEVFKTYAYINSLSGSEFWKAFEISKQQTIIFEMRYNKFFSQLNTKDYVVEYNGNLYNIIFLDNVQFQNKTFKVKGELING